MRQAANGQEIIHVSGVRICANLLVTMQQDPLEADCACTIAFGAVPPSGSSWYRLPGADHLPGGAYLRTDGMAAVIPHTNQSAELRAVQIRTVAPFAAALQGRITLHASCVGRHNRAHCFIGESGAGKSTFARCLAAIGWQQICDDLLPIRLVGETWVVRALPSPLALEGIFFLERGPPDCDLQITEVLPREALLAHLRNGFGELPDATVWQNQFEAYAAIANGVRSYRLIVPHDLSRLSSYVRHWADWIERLAFR